MENKILEILREIKAYIAHLTFNLQLDVSLCDFYYNIPAEVSDYLSEFMIHPNLYCQKMKVQCMKNCLRQQKLVKKKALRCNHSFSGACYAGVQEYIFPIIENNVYYGFVSVTGYKSPTPRPSAPHFKTKSLHTTYEKSLKEELPDEHFLNAVISPLKNSLKLLAYYYDSNEIKALKTHDFLYQSILRYVSENYLRPLTMPIIAEELHYSESYLSHVFKERNKISIIQYIQQLKIKKAKEMLRNTDKSIMEIAESLGFQDSNYFTAVFKKSMGISPRKYRAEQQRSSYPPLLPRQK